MARVLVPLAEGVEELEAITITDLLVRAGIEVVTAGLKPGLVQASRGARIQPSMTLDEALQQEYDMIVLPGGQGATLLQQDSRVIDVVQQMAAGDKYTAAICAAPKVLASAGILENRRCTAYPGTLIPQACPGVLIQDTPLEIDGKVITSRGPGTAMDFALKLIEVLTDAATRQKVEDGLSRPTRHELAG